MRGTLVRLVFCGCLLLAGCGDGGSGPGGFLPAESLELTPSSAIIGLGLTQPLTAVARDRNGAMVSGAVVTFTSSNPQIASVDQRGVVTGQSVGPVSITARVGEFEASATVEVSAAPPGHLQLLFSSYLGGSQQDQVRDIAVDGAGNIYVTGGTASANFPGTAGTLDPSFNGDYDVYIAKLNSAGALLWATYLGGPNYDRAYAIEVDHAGYIYVAGRAGAGFPVTAGAFQPAFAGSPDDPPYGPQDGFVCKLAPDATAIVFCSYFGTADPQIVRDLAIDSQGDIYLGSSAIGGGFPAGWLTGYRRTPYGGVDAVVARVAGDGSQVRWATYLGGSQDEAGEVSIRVNGAGDVFVLTTSGSPDAPTPNGFDRSLGGGRDAYLARLSGDGRRLVFGTFLGGSAGESVETHELALDPSGNPVIATGTKSADFPTTPGAFQRTYGGTGSTSTGGGTNYGGDVFVARVSSDGSRLLASTLIGGPEGEGAEGVGVDGQGNIYVTGATYSSLPFTRGGSQGGIAGDADLFVIKLAPDLRRILYASYLGGTDQDYGRAAAVTPAGEFIIGGNVFSTNWPTQGGGQSRPGGSLDGAIAKFR